MTTISTFRTLAPFTTLSRPSRLASACSALAERAMAIALLAAIAVVIFFVAIGVASIVLELTRALAMAGPFGQGALALMVMAAAVALLRAGVPAADHQV